MFAVVLPGEPKQLESTEYMGHFVYAKYTYRNCLFCIFIHSLYLEKWKRFWWTQAVLVHFFQLYLFVKERIFLSWTPCSASILRLWHLQIYYSVSMRFQSYLGCLYKDLYKVWNYIYVNAQRKHFAMFHVIKWIRLGNVITWWNIRILDSIIFYYR